MKSSVKLQPARKSSPRARRSQTAINQMDQVTQQNAAMVEESTAASHSLSQETEQLSDLIGQFKIGRVKDVKPMRRETRAAPHALRPAAKATAAANRKRGLRMANLRLLSMVHPSATIPAGKSSEPFRKMDDLQNKGRNDR